MYKQAWKKLLTERVMECGLSNAAFPTAANYSDVETAKKLDNPASVAWASNCLPAFAKPSDIMKSEGVAAMLELFINRVFH